MKGIVTAFGIFIFSCLLWAADQQGKHVEGGAPVPTEPARSLPQMVPSGTSTPAPSPSATPASAKVTEADGRKLFRSFKRAQRTEMRALEHRHRQELTELKASQRARRKEWESSEREKRRKYFEENTKGPDRRAYIKDFNERRTAFLAILKDEMTQRQAEQKARREALKEDHASRMREFDEYLKKGERPPETIWPGR